MSFSVSGKTAIVTGSASGIGLAIGALTGAVDGAFTDAIAEKIKASQPKPPGTPLKPLPETVVGPAP